MAQILTGMSQGHVRSGRYAQRERPAATIPSRIRRGPAGRSALPSRGAAPMLALLVAARGPIV